MDNINIRVGTTLFTNVNRFPYGFKRSGDFSIDEATILSVHGHILHSLALNILEPESKEEEHFVLVFNGPTAAVTPAERVWAKYTKLTCTKKNFFTLNTAGCNVEKDNEASEGSVGCDVEITAQFLIK